MDDSTVDTKVDTSGGRGQSRPSANRSVFFSVFTPPICNRRATHASVIVVSRGNCSAIRALRRSGFGFAASSVSDPFRRAHSSEELLPAVEPAGVGAQKSLRAGHHGSSRLSCRSFRRGRMIHPAGILDSQLARPTARILAKSAVPSNPQLADSPDRPFFAAVTSDHHMVPAVRNVNPRVSCHARLLL